MIKGTNTGSSNPPVKSKGDYHGKPRTPVKGGFPLNPAPSNPAVRQESYSGQDRVK